jgi:hypothetical protein
VASTRGELVRVAELALALNRKSRTIRQWESLGHLPQAPYRSESYDPRGERRLYSPEHVEGIVRIAAEEGILYGKPANIRKTAFAQRVRRLYDQLAAGARHPLPPIQRPA